MDFQKLFNILVNMLSPLFFFTIYIENEYMLCSHILCMYVRISSVMILNKSWIPCIVIFLIKNPVYDICANNYKKHHFIVISITYLHNITPNSGIGDFEKLWFSKIFLL